MKTDFRSFLVDFVPFLKFCIAVGDVAVTIKKLGDFRSVLNFYF